jgi:hypothetical protein
VELAQHDTNANQSYLPRASISVTEMRNFLRISVVLSPAAGWLTMVASERGGEGIWGGVAGTAGYLGEAEISRA